MKWKLFFLLFVFSSSFCFAQDESIVESDKAEIDLVAESIELKRSGVSDSTIVEHLYHMGESGQYKRTFGNTQLTKDEIQKLKQAGFQDDFIAKFEGHPQYVTLGVAGIWLTETTDLAAAPMLRIFLVPRGYFEERPPFWTWDFSCHLKRLDLNFGITNLTSSGGKSDEKKNYVLAGFSYELNRSALFNFGGAVLPGDIDGKQTQFYFGITVDYNFLKSLGIVDK